MRPIYLAIENDIAIHDRDSAFWLSRNVASVRVSSMTEGINGDNINFKPQLPLLREATNDPNIHCFICLHNAKASRSGKSRYRFIRTNW